MAPADGLWSVRPDRQRRASISDRRGLGQLRWSRWTHPDQPGLEFVIVREARSERAGRGLERLLRASKYSGDSQDWRRIAMRYDSAHLLLKYLHRSKLHLLAAVMSPEPGSRNFRRRAA
jgi:hypothetical protein